MPISGDLVLGPSNMNRMSYPGWVAKEVKFRDTQPLGLVSVTVLPTRGDKNYTVGTGPHA